MDRMKTFLTYALLIVGFFALSILLENGLLMAMYKNISGSFNGDYQGTGTRFSIQNVSAEACNVNGYISFDLINTTGKFIDKCYAKIDLYNEQKLLADTKYIEISNVHPDYKQRFNIKFKANNIEKFAISIQSNLPDKTNIINVFGWEIDLTNVFGLGIDLSNLTIFGVKLTDLFSWDNAKTTLGRFGNWSIAFLESVPWWGYAIGGTIVLLRLPVFYLFGIF